VAANSHRSDASLSVGQTIAGKYILTRKLGEGGMCVVFEAQHAALRRNLAVKVLKSDLASDPSAVTRFEREARASAQLTSLNVARVYDVDYLPGGTPYITMELLVGHDLGAELNRVGQLPMATAIDVVTQACAGIEEAHARGIIHRDLKPENLFLTDLGNLTDRKLVKILDFGIAKHLSDNARRLTSPDSVFGTVDYMSPEQIRSSSQVDHRTDIWSLGVILFELLTGRTPFEGDARAVIAQIISEPAPSPTAFVHHLPPALVAIVAKALAKDPAHRFQSADDMARALASLADAEPIASVIARLPPTAIPQRGLMPPPAYAIADAGAAAASVLSSPFKAGSRSGTRPRNPRRARRIALATLGLAGAVVGSAFFISGYRSRASSSFFGNGTADLPLAPTKTTQSHRVAHDETEPPGQASATHHRADLAAPAMPSPETTSATTATDNGASADLPPALPSPGSTSALNAPSTAAPPSTTTTVPTSPSPAVATPSAQRPSSSGSGSPSSSPRLPKHL